MKTENRWSKGSTRSSVREYRFTRVKSTDCQLLRLSRSARGGGSLRKLAGVHKVQYYEHRTFEKRGVMKNSWLRHKHVQLDQRKLNRALRILGARTETEALDRALSVVVSEDKIDTALRKARGKGRIRKVFK